MTRTGIPRVEKRAPEVSDDSRKTLPESSVAVGAVQFTDTKSSHGATKTWMSSGQSKISGLVMSAAKGESGN